MSIKIIDNFLKKDVYLNIKKTIDLNTFPWFLNVKVGSGVDIKDLKDKGSTNGLNNHSSKTKRSI